MSSIILRLSHLVQLLRWDKPSGRAILLIPAGWSLWLTPTAPPEKSLVGLIVAGGIFISAAGCIANDLWDRNIDKNVPRTRKRPLASGDIQIQTAAILLAVMLSLCLAVVSYLPIESRGLCLKLAFISLPPILIYPSAKRWFAYPQALLAICWGFAVLIPWAASESNLEGGIPLIGAWCATLVWTFGFDTVYAMADKYHDKNLGLHSSVLTLKSNVIKTVSISYLLTSLFIALAAFFAKIEFFFWPIWLIATFGMQREIWILKRPNLFDKNYGQHFQHQVLLGGLLLLGLILGRIQL